MNTITIAVGSLEFEFSSMQDWVNKGPNIWREHYLTNDRGICVDAKGRIVECGADFERAKQESAYPIKVYRKKITQPASTRGEA